MLCGLVAWCSWSYWTIAWETRLTWFVVMIPWPGTAVYKARLGVMDWCFPYFQVKGVDTLTFQ